MCINVNMMRACESHRQRDPVDVEIFFSTIEISACSFFKTVSVDGVSSLCLVTAVVLFKTARQKECATLVELHSEF